MGRCARAVPELCPSRLPGSPAEGIASPCPREHKRAPQIHECQGTGKGGCFEAFVDVNVFRRPQSSLLTAEEPNSARPTQTDLVFHPVHGHNLESPTLSSGARLVPQQLSAPALTLGTVWSLKLSSCPYSAVCWLGNRMPRSSAVSIWDYRKGRGKSIWEPLKSRDY